MSFTQPPAKHRYRIKFLCIIQKSNEKNLDTGPATVRRFSERLIHFSFSAASRRCEKWNDYNMYVAPYQKDKPIYYEFTRCPIAEFAKKYNLLEVMPAFCNPDYTAMELIHAKLIRNTTCSNGCKCDYRICGDKDKYCSQYPEYKDNQGYRRN